MPRLVNAFALTLLLCGCVGIRMTPALQMGAASGDMLRVGSVAFHRCLGGEYYCGVVRVPIDPAHVLAGKIGVAVALLPHTNRSTPSKDTIVAVEGGPGYPSIDSRSLYRALYAPLLATRDLLLIDNRGTGQSEAIVCRPLQRAALMELWQVTRCGRQLGTTADLYGTAIAADDMAHVLSAMQRTKVDLYGDSYGSFFVQAFAARHPQMVRSIVLDGAYQVIGGSPWYPSTAPTLRKAFDAACARSPVCATRDAPSMDRIERLLDELRTKRESVTASQLAFVMDSAGLDPLAFRDLDAAARAYVDRGDRTPMERLRDEAYAEEEGAGGRARGYSQGLFAAASCSDNPQAYDMRLRPPERIAGWHAALARKKRQDPHLYSPFAIDEFLGMPIDYAYVPLCQTWPVASSRHPAGEPVPPNARFPSVPVLVLNGDLDTITTPAEGAKAAQLFPHATQAIVANTGHVTALDDFDGCAATIVRRFTLTNRVEAGCAARVPAIHLVPSFSQRLAEVTPAVAVSGNEAPERELRAAAAAVLGSADVLARSYEFGRTSGGGLRGGSYSASPGDAADRAVLSQIRWTSDLAISGTAELDVRAAEAKAHLTIGGAVGGAIDAAWPTTGATAQARISGTIGGYTVRAVMPAP